MNVQKYLLNGLDRSEHNLDHNLDHNLEHRLNQLKTEYGIKVKEYDNFIGLNYDQVNSPKSHPITVECRSLKLHKHDLSIASRAFDRFFNYGEVPDMYKDFDISNSVIM